MIYILVNLLRVTVFMKESSKYTHATHPENLKVITHPKQKGMSLLEILSHKMNKSLAQIYKLFLMTIIILLN